MKKNLSNQLELFQPICWYYLGIFIKIVESVLFRNILCLMSKFQTRLLFHYAYEVQFSGAPIALCKKHV